MTLSVNSPAQARRALERANTFTLPRLSTSFAEEVERARLRVLSFDDPMGSAEDALIQALSLEDRPEWDVKRPILELAESAAYRALVAHSETADTISGYGGLGLIQVVHDARIYTAGRLAGRKEERNYLKRHGLKVGK